LPSTTAAGWSKAIAAIAFGRSATVVDGNVERVVARLFAVDEPLPNAKPKLRALAATLTPAKRAGDFAQAMMDLGATICTPRRPRCMLCPLREDCSAVVSGDPENFPVRLPKAASRSDAALLSSPCVRTAPFSCANGPKKVCSEA